MYKKAWCTCKPSAFLPFSLPSLSSLIKLRNTFMRDQTFLVVKLFSMRHLAKGSREVSSLSPGKVDFSCSPAQWTKFQASHPLTKSFTKTARSGPGQAKWEKCLPQEQAGIQVFSSPGILLVSSRSFKCLLLVFIRWRGWFLIKQNASLWILWNQQPQLGHFDPHCFGEFFHWQSDMVQLSSCCVFWSWPSMHLMLLNALLLS